VATPGISPTNVANYVPQIWSKEVKAAVENKLVVAKLVDRSYEKELSFGDKLNIADLTNVSANAVNTEQDLTLSDVIQNTTQLIINYWYEANIGENHMMRIQNRPDYLNKARAKCGYAIAKQIDTSLNTLFADFDNSVGADGSALTDDVLLAAKEYLDLADAPFEGRALVIDPESLTDLLKIDKFVRMDYGAKNTVIGTGQIGRIYGCDVYMTNNLYALNTNYHNAAMFQKEALALVMQDEIKTEQRDWWQRHVDVIVCTALWGCIEMRGDFGVRIKTRS